MESVTITCINSSEHLPGENYRPLVGREEV